MINNHLNYVINISIQIILMKDIKIKLSSLTYMMNMVDLVAIAEETPRK